MRYAVDKLPESWARAIRMFYWQTKSTREIARDMDVYVGVVRAYLFRGRNRLRQMLTA